jgi:hypothetical protein
MLERIGRCPVGEMQSAMDALDADDLHAMVGPELLEAQIDAALAEVVASGRGVGRRPSRGQALSAAASGCA